LPDRVPDATAAVKQGYTPVNMQAWRQYCVLGLLGGVLSAAGFGQSLAEAARQEQTRKSAAPPPHHVYTNEDFPSHAADTAAEEEGPAPAEAKPASDQETKKPSAQELRAKILAQKQKVQALETRIAEIQKRLDERERQSVGDASVYEHVYLGGKSGPGPCALSDAVASHPYQDWCDEPAKLTAEMDKKKAELEKERALLEQMQEEARRMSFRSNVYDPD